MAEPNRHDDEFDTGRYHATRTAAHDLCVVCGPANPVGLGLTFSRIGEGDVAAEFHGNTTLEGYPGLLHGGVICALVDGAMTNCLFTLGIVAVTAELAVRFIAGVRADRPVQVSAHRIRTRGQVHAVRAEIRQDGHLMVRATGKFMNKPRHRAGGD
jgi:uncharacterized protein (TIGR00369 family)